MSCKAKINTALTTPTTVLSGGAIPIGAVIHRSGCGINANGNGLTIRETGDYDVLVSVTVLPTAATGITATLMRDGVAVPGATATAAPAAAGSAVNLSLLAQIRHVCSCSTITLTVVLSAAGTVNNMAIVAEHV